MIEDFREYHLLMEGGRNETKEKLNSIIEIINNNETPKKDNLNSLKDSIAHGDFAANSYNLNNLKIIFEKGLYTQEEQEIIKNKIKETATDIQKKQDEYKKLINDLEGQSKPKNPEEPKQNQKGNLKQTKEKSEFINNDVKSDYQWLFDNREKISNLIEKNPDGVGRNNIDKNLIYFFIISDIAFQKLLRINKNEGDIINIEDDEGNKFQVASTSSGNDYSMNIKNESGKHFFSILKKLKKLTYSHQLKLSSLVSNYVNEHKELDLNEPSERQKVLEDVKNNKVFNSLKTSNFSSSNNISKNNNLKKDFIEKSDEEEENQERDQAHPENKDKRVKYDPEDVSSLDVNSTKDQINFAVLKTFGSVEHNSDGSIEHGRIFDNAIQKVKRAKDRIEKDVKKDNDYIKGTKDREKELFKENVILKELKSNPLLKEEYEILQEKIFGPEGERSKRRWKNELEGEGEHSKLEKFRMEKANEAYELAKEITTDYVSLSKKASAISQIKKIALDYVVGLNKRVNNLIKRNDYGALGALVRDIKVSNRERVDNKNERYENSRRGQIRETEEKIILKKLDELNNNPKSISDKHYKNIFSLWSTENIYDVDFPDPKLKDELGEMEENQKISDKIIDFAKKELYSGVDAGLYRHIAGLLNKGNYTNLVDKEQGVKLLAKLKNDLKFNPEYEKQEEQNKEEQNKKEQNKEEQNKEEQNKEEQNKEEQNKEEQNKEEQNKENSQASKEAKNMENIILNKKNEEKTFYLSEHGSGLKHLESIKKFDEADRKKLASKIIDKNYTHKGNVLKYNPKKPEWIIDDKLQCNDELFNKILSKLRSLGINVKESNTKALPQSEAKALPNTKSEIKPSSSLKNYKKEIDNLFSKNNKSKIMNILGLSENGIRNNTIINKNTLKDLSDLEFYELINYINTKNQENKLFNINNNPIKFKFGNKEERRTFSNQLEAKNLKQKAEEASKRNNSTDLVPSNGNAISQEVIRPQTNWLKGRLDNLFKNLLKTGVKEASKEKEVKSDDYIDKFGSVVTENYIFTEEGKPLPKTSTEKAILMSLSSNPQEAAEGKQWIIDNVYHGNPLASKIVDEFVKQNSKEKGKAKEVLKAMNNQQNTKLNNQTNISQQNVQPNVQQQPINQQANMQTNAQQNVNQAIQNTNQNQQAIDNGTPQQVANATVTTGAADGFPNRLYKKIIRRKIGF